MTALPLKSQLLAVAAAYCGPRGRSESRLSNKLFGSGKRLRELRENEGQDMASGRIERALQALSDEWPEGATWPEGVPRPEPRAPSAEAQATP